MHFKIIILVSILAISALGCRATNIVSPIPDKTSVVITKDSVAERMLLYQRSNGGWPQPGGNAIDYSKTLSETLKTTLKSEKNKHFKS